RASVGVGSSAGSSANGRAEGTTRAAAGQMMHDGLAPPDSSTTGPSYSTSSTSSSAASPVQPGGEDRERKRTIRTSFSQLGLGFGFIRTKSREQLGADCAAGVDADQDGRRGTGPSAGMNGQDVLPYTGYSASDASESTPLETSPDTSTTTTTISNPHARSTAKTRFTKGLTNLAKVPLTILIPTLDIDWGSLPLGLGESRRRQAEDEANSREAERILDEQVRLFEERRGVGALNSRGGGGGLRAIGAGGVDEVRSGGPGGMGGGGGGPSGSGSGSNARAENLRDGPPAPPGAGATYGAIVSAPPPSQGTDLERAALRAKEDAEEEAEAERRRRRRWRRSRGSFFGLLGFLSGRDGEHGSATAGSGGGGGGGGGGPSTISQHTPLLSSSRPRNDSTSTIDPADPYGYRSLAGPTLLPAHASYVEQRQRERRRARRGAVVRRWVWWVGVAVVVLVLGWVGWVYLLEYGARIGVGL
ncbi:unnamed protein product, partial [Tilletia controversa]